MSPSGPTPLAPLGSPAVPAPATAKQLHPSSHRTDRPIGMDAVQAIATGLAQVITHEDRPPAQGEVRRTRILATAAYDAWIVSLGPHTAIEPHDHDGSIGIIVVTEGHLIEFGLDEDGQRRSRLRHLVGGDSAAVGITHRHCLVNPDIAPTTTVQVFSPPLGHEHTDGAHGARTHHID